MGSIEDRAIKVNNGGSEFSGQTGPNAADLPPVDNLWISIAVDWQGDSPIGRAGRTRKQLSNESAALKEWQQLPAFNPCQLPLSGTRSTEPTRSAGTARPDYLPADSSKLSNLAALQLWNCLLLESLILKVRRCLAYLSTT